MMWDSYTDVAPAALYTVSTTATAWRIAWVVAMRIAARWSRVSPPPFTAAHSAQAVSTRKARAERSVLSVGAPLVQTGPLYQIPRTLMFASGDASVAVGMTRAALNAFYELAGAKTPRAMQGLLRDQPMVQADVGHAEANLRAARALLTEAVGEIWEEVTTAGEPSLDRRAALRIATTHAIRLCVQIIDSLYTAAGATGIYEGHLLQRYFQDIHVISQHMQSRMAIYELVGRYWLGLPIDEQRL